MPSGETWRLNLKFTDNSVDCRSSDTQWSILCGNIYFGLNMVIMDTGELHSRFISRDLVDQHRGACRGKIMYVNGSNKTEGETTWTVSVTEIFWLSMWWFCIDANSTRCDFPDVFYLDHMPLFVYRTHALLV
jgi:hypothetical protein